MEFLNRLYESNYFGIGLFAVISFLVVTFLVVLFFGKKDEQKRRLDDNTNSYAVPGINDELTFKETSTPTPVEVKSNSIPTNDAIQSGPISMEPINEQINSFEMPTPQFNEPVKPTVTPVVPTAPVMPTTEFEPKADVSPVIEPVISPVTPSVMRDINSEVVTPVIPTEPVTPVKVEPVIPTPQFSEPVTPVIPKMEEPTFTTPVDVPIINRERETIQDVTPRVEPKIVEPVRFDLPTEEPTIPIINEPVTPVFPKVEEPTIIEEPTIGSTYYQPIKEEPVEEVKVPNIDFDALAKTISAELDELEKSNNSKVTPIEEVVEKPTNQFSSVYVNNNVSPVRVDSPLPKKIDLPTKKD